MGLEIKHGDPALVLFNAIANHSGGVSVADIWNSPLFSRNNQQTYIHMVGRPFGRATDFTLLRQTSKSVGFRSHEASDAFECRMTVEVGVGFPDFEVMGRVHGAIQEYRLMPRPWRTSGDNDLDARFAVAAGDARVPPLLAPILRNMAGMAHVHVVGHDKRLHWVAAPSVASAMLRILDHVRVAMEHLACTLEGRPVPA
jgi:hypothetical protein